MNIHLVMFSTNLKFGIEDYYAFSAVNLIESAKMFGIEHFHMYSPEMLDVSESDLQYMLDNPDPGFGFYMWKPIVILDVLNKIKDGDVVIYHDAGRPEYNYKFKKDVNILIDKVIKEHEGIGIGLGGWDHNQYTKDKCFKLMNCDREDIRNRPQVAGNWCIFQKNNKVLEFVKEWKYWCLNKEVIGSPIDEINHKEFIRHTWDQSILTNLFYMHNIKPTPYATVGWEKDINNFINGPLV
jgi:hypothetical protein